MPRTPSGRPTIRTVAEAAGVSAATVSYVLRGSNSSIPEETAQRVMAAADALGYRPNQAAQAMRTGRNGLVLLHLRMLSDPWSLAVGDAIGRRAAAQGLSPLILADGDWHEAVSRLQPDVAFVDSPATDPGTVARLYRLAARGQRLVVFSETLAPAGYDVVRSAAAPGSALVLEELLRRTSSIAYLTPRRSSSDPVPPGSRQGAYVAAVRQGRIDEDLTVSYDGSRSDAFRAAVELLRSERRPRAIAANTDYAGLAAIAAASFLGLRVPDDLLVTGLGNTAEAAESTPSLTSAGPDDFYERQAQLVLDAVDHLPGEGRLHEFTWRLHARASTAHP